MTREPIGSFSAVRTPLLGQIVHVSLMVPPCRVGIVLDPGQVLSRVRVLVPAAVGYPGEHDEEGDVPHHTNAVQVPNPEGGLRWLLSWHDPSECTDE
jgi:hypothetical protein